MTESSASAATRPDTDAAAPEPLLVEVADGVAWLRLNRPEAMNSLDNALKDALVAALAQVGDDPAVRCVVLDRLRSRLLRRPGPQGARAQPVGPGLDPGDDGDRPLQPDRHRALDDEQARHRRAQRRRGGRRAVASPSRATSGSRRRAPGSTPRSPASRSRATPAPRGRLPRLVGPARAKELLLLPRTVPADEALALGLVTKVVPAEELEQTVRELARTLADGPTLAYGSIRRAVAYSRRHRPRRRARPRGRADGAHRCQQRPPGRGRRLPRQGEAHLHRPLSAARRPAVTSATRRPHGG